MIQGEFYFDPDDPIYQVHFPSFPVVPGSLIINAFLRAIQKAFTLPHNITIQSFKFIQFVKPGHATYQMKISESHIRCFLYQNNTIVAKGLIQHET